MNFIEFMEQLVIPAQMANRDHIRLDGKTKGPNGRTFGKFEHKFNHIRAIWKVHYDTHYEPLKLAYEAARNGEEPFVKGPTNTEEEDGESKLKLKPKIREIQRELQLKRGMSDCDYLNIYLVEPPKKKSNGKIS